jgi:hypothetical protein
VVDRLRSATASDGLLEEFRKLWIEDFLTTSRAISDRDRAIFQNPIHNWEEIKDQLLAAASPIEVRTINGLAGEVLDYEHHNGDGLNVIAIGGDKLSRGLTLEGLSVSYFLRCSRMYDTLMQMGRWFGYRPGYLDLCRLYTTAELCEWFGHIANATEELREEFSLMAQSGGTPRDFGLRVRSHPKLMVTSQVKMRHGATMQVTFQGDIVETINFYRNSNVVEANWKAAENLVEDLGNGAGVPARARRENSSIWSDVPVDRVISFLDQYREHESAVKVRTQLLRQYIEKEAKSDRLQNWTVLISGGSGEEWTIGRTRFQLVERGWHLTGDTDADKNVEKKTLVGKNQYRIRRLVNPPDEWVDLDIGEFEAALQDTIIDWQTDPGDRSEPNQPAGRFARQHRSSGKGLLILYPLVPNEAKAENANVPILAFAISFPSVAGGEASKVVYTVNNVYQREELS